MIQYLTIEDVAEFNERFVGPDALADVGLLESAVLRPQSSVFQQDAYTTIHEKAAALFHSLIRNHPFVDGNKRTAVLAVGVFYRLNGWQLVADDGDLVALALDAAEGITTADAIAKRLENFAVQVDLPPLEDDSDPSA